MAGNKPIIKPSEDKIKEIKNLQKILSEKENEIKNLMTSRKLDLICNAINEQNALDEEQILKETKINSRLVNIWNNNRESLHKKNDFRERRFQDGRVRNELMKLENVSTTKEQRGNTADTKMNTYPHQNFLLDPKNKKNIYNYIDNLNFILDKNNEYRDNYHKNMLKRMNFFNFNKKRYFTNIYDKFYNVNNDKKWMSNDIIFFLNRAVKDEIKEDIDFKHANKHNKYQTFLKNRNDDILDFNQNFNTRLIEAKTRYNDFYLDKDDILLKRVNDVRDGKYDFFDDPDRDYYHKTGINKDELKKRHKLEENKKKKRQETIKSLEEQRRKRMQNILEKETHKFKMANKKEDMFITNQKNAHIGTMLNKEDLEKKEKELYLRNDRILKSQTVYKKKIYEMPSTFPF